VYAQGKRKDCFNPQPEQLDSLRRWHDALEGKNKEAAFDLMNKVLDGKITHETALALLESIRD
jgi:predicted metal-dependent hydrolase